MSTYLNDSQKMATLPFSRASIPIVAIFSTEAEYQHSSTYLTIQSFLKSGSSIHSVQPQRNIFYINALNVRFALWRSFLYAQGWLRSRGVFSMLYENCVSKTTPVDLPCGSNLAVRHFHRSSTL